MTFRLKDKNLQVQCNWMHLVMETSRRDSNTQIMTTA